MKFFLIPPSSDTSNTPPRQDEELWGQPLLAGADSPHDWCTVAQAQEHLNEGKPDSVLRDISTGRVKSNVLTVDEANRFLEKEQGRRGKE